MKIDNNILSSSIKDFKLFGKISPIYLMRKHQLNFEMCSEICKTISKRFPNLWKDRDENFKKKMKV